MNLPENELQKLESIADVEQLEELLSRPTAEVLAGRSAPRWPAWRGAPATRPTTRGA